MQLSTPVLRRMTVAALAAAAAAGRWWTLVESRARGERWDRLHALAGGHVVYGFVSDDAAGTQHHVMTYDIRAGRGSQVALHAVSGTPVDDVVLTKEGRLALIRREHVSPPGSLSVSVCRVRSCRRPEDRTVDRDPGIVSRSLRRDGGRACWKVTLADGQVEERCHTL